MPVSEHVPKQRQTLGRWAEIDSPFHGRRRVFVPAQVFAQGTLPTGAYLVPMVGDGGWVAVVVCTVHCPHVCVGIARLMCDQAVEDLLQEI